jgi:Cu-processing system ATP-binding protein
MSAPLTLTLPHPAIQITGLTKRFGRVRVLDQVSFDIKPGRITAVLGPNAAGKSTIIKAILGLVRADSGHIQVNGSQVDGAPEYRSRIGYMPQSPRFPENLTANHIVAMLRDLREEAGEDLGLLDELGLRGEMGKPIRNLSGGTRQKLNAAVAFLFRPSLLILDEPTAGLDPVASQILKQRLRRARSEGSTVVLTSHHLAEVEELVDDVIVLLEGRVAYAGPLRSLIATAGEDRLERAVADLMQRAAP